jgi:hypothetical protein
MHIQRDATLDPVENGAATPDLDVIGMSAQAQNA